MTLVQRFALIFGVIYLVVGILGFIPPLIFSPPPLLPGAWGPFGGLLISVFAVNWLHSLAHFAIGVAGLLSFRSPASASTYALVIGVVYILLFVVGLIRLTPYGPLPFLLPLDWPDNILHLLTALIAFAAYYLSREVPAPRRV